MKIGAQHRTAAIGSDAEYYFGALSGLYNNPNGKFRPDFITNEEKFNPKLSIELKSGRNKRGVLCDYQLRYMKTLKEDYQNLFGENVNGKEIAYYYSLLYRNDNIKAEELEKPFSTIRLTWGDQYFIPGEMGVYIFAIRKTMRKVYQSQKRARNARNQKKRIPEILDPRAILSQTMQGIEYLIENEVDEEGSNWSSHQKRDAQSWQNLEGRDLEAIFKKDFSIATKTGIERINLIEEIYPKFSFLRRVEIPSTGNSKIYVLCEEEHEKLFDSQFRSAVKKRISKMNELTEERREAECLLDKVVPIEVRRINGYDLFNKEGYEEEVEIEYSFKNLSPKELIKLRRLSFWASKKDNLPGYLNDGKGISDSLEPSKEEIRDIKVENVPF